MALKISDLYAYIHITLREDPTIQSLLGIPPNAPMELFATKIQKRQKPLGNVQENLPIVCYYMNPGQRGNENHLEYITTFDFDIYTPNDVETALDIADRIKEIFDDKHLSLNCGSHFKSEFVTCSEDSSDLEDTYKFFIRILFSLSLDK